MIEYAPGCFASPGEIVTASDGRRWFLEFPAVSLARPAMCRWRRADIPLDQLPDDTTPVPPELVSRRAEPPRRRR